MTNPAYASRPLAQWWWCGLLALVLLCVWGRSRLRAEYEYLRIVGGDSESQVTAFAVLEHMGRPAAVPPLLRLLEHGDPWRRGTAARALARYGGEHVVARLTRLASTDADPFVHEAAIEALGSIGDPRALPAMLEFGRGDARAFGIIGKLGAPGRQAVLDDYDAQTDPGARAASLRRVCTLHSEPRAAGPLTRALTDPAWEVRAVGAECVGSFLGEGALPLLKPLLDDPSPEVRVAAVEAVASLGSRAGVASARAMLSDGALPEHLRIRAAMALGRSRDQGSFALLRDTWAHDPSWNVREAAHAALQLIFPPLDPRAYGRDPTPSAR